MFKQTLLSKKSADGAIRGCVTHPQVNNNLPGVKFFDAVLFGVPVEIDRDKKVVDQDAFDRIIDKLVKDGVEPLSEVQFTKVRFDNVNFAIKIYDCAFVDCTFINCNFTSSEYISGKTSSSEFVNCNFKDSSIYVDFSNCIIKDCSFEKATLQSFFKDSVLDNIDFSCSNMRKMSFTRVSCKSPCFKDACLDGVYFHGCNIENADYEGVYITMGGARYDEVEAHKKSVISALSMT